ncbi:MAG: thioesterase family protein [Myxococcota bacterium]
MNDDRLAHWPVTLGIPVAWGDMDSLGHVNNTIYLRWFESARIIYFDKIGIAQSMAAKNVGPILAQQDINYRLPVRHPDTVNVDVTVSRVGTTSFVMGFRIRSVGLDKLVADGQGVIVMVNYASGQKVPLGDDLKQRILDLEAGRPRSMAMDAGSDRSLP